MNTYINGFVDEVLGRIDWTVKSILFDVDWYNNYFWGLIAISLIVWFLEIAFPWRKEQSIFRKDFWLDAFYMFFNFFIFSIIIGGFYKIIQLAFKDFGISSTSMALFNANHWPAWAQLIVFFVVLDFVQWFTHTLLHKYAFLWNYHKVHHSVKEMGFAAHLRYHWMENILYKPLKTFAVMLLFGFEPEQAFIVHFIAITIGHFNHSNIKITWGIFRYVINNPVMHLYHHAYTLPKGRYGVNFGISLSLWDYIFKTHYVPEDSGTIKLGFSGDEKFPENFIDQNLYGFKKK